MRKTIGSVLVGCVLAAVPLSSLTVAEAAPSAPTAVVQKAVAKAVNSKKTYKNCTALNKKYKHGVGKSGAKDKVRGKSKPVKNFKKSTKIYNEAMKHNRDLDRDRDGVACEKR